MTEKKFKELLERFVQHKVDAAVGRALKSKLMEIQRMNADSIQDLAKSAKETINIQREFVREVASIDKRLSRIEKVMGIATKRRRKKKQTQKDGYIA